MNQAPDVVVAHHPSALRVKPQTREVPAGFVLDCDGAITTAQYHSLSHWQALNVEISNLPLTATTPPGPRFDEEYFEWLDLLEAVEQATDRFVMVEVGAGYGRWSVHGALAAQAAGLTPHLVTIEAEPSHARWLREHFAANGLSVADHDTLWAAIGVEGGFVPFIAGRSSDHYGQTTAKRSDTPYPSARERRRLRIRSAIGKPAPANEEGRSRIWVPSITLSDVLAPHPLVDLVDMDIQGAEFPVLQAAIDRLNSTVKRVHVGTHGQQIEKDLRELFTDHGWTCLWDFASGTTATTPYGLIPFVDGVQTWVNPRAGLEPAARTTASGDEVSRLRRRVARMKERLHAMKAKQREG